MTDPAVAAALDLAERAGPTSLAEVFDAAALQERVDRKYLVRSADLTTLLGPVLTGSRCLEIEGVRQFRYESVYFDTADLRCYRDHVQGRRIRAKVRTRTYADSGECVLEVKRSGSRDLTLKDRMPWDAVRADVIGPEGEAFVAERVPFVAGPWRPAAATSYLRCTFLVGRQERTTVDAGLRFSRGERVVRARPAWTLVESKTAGPRGAVDRALAAGGYRPVSASKYCLAVALLEPSVRSNPWHRIMRRQFGWRPTPGVGRAGWAA
ncbi:conserved hypothetical protein [Nostocoides japonicum T1-X7]|uniref:VTC domain-containing protein n=1 Tax=Nostocoides japonicum T1-X7 TaxID=1194083 RepID=A0A077LV08_9MICO|nr:polyphosphate polymerase domain-containing protein [Tetrasphaera japonica]CCH77516.1 conserved hypothetical protein [Tetrasphaera japonica T1-X7]